MPGFFGVFDKGELGPERLNALGSRMAAALRTRPWLQVERWSASGLSAGRVHSGVLNPDPQPLPGGPPGVHSWFDGRIYGEGEEPGRRPTGAQAARWLETGEAAFASLDGEYSLACYEEPRHRLTLVTDRIGSRAVYVAETKRWFAYASEVKAILAILDRLPSIDRLALTHFLAYRRVWGRRTLWEGIHMLPPAALVQVSRAGTKERQYWSADAIPIVPRSTEDAMRELSTLWRQSIARRRGPGIMPHLLSGGLDSRAVLAELRRQGQEVVTFTFGERDCPDMRIAAQCARVAGVEHRDLPFDRDTWWHGREEAIWQVDGMASARDLHAFRAAEELRRGCGLLLKNLFGNSLLGGRRPIEATPQPWPTTGAYQARIRYHAGPFVTEEEAVEASGPDLDPIVVGPSPIVMAIHASGRRANLPGCFSLMAHGDVLIPGVDLPILELLMGGLTEEQQLDGAFYKPFLASEYPDYFADIPWQDTGRGLRESWWVRNGRDWRRRIGRKVHRPVRRPAYFADYDRLLADSLPLAWLRRQTLLMDDLLDGAAGRYLSSVPDKKGWSTHVLGLLTLEIYFRQADGLTRVGEAADAAPAARASGDAIGAGVGVP